MTDYSHIVPDEIVLDGEDARFAEKLLLVISENGNVSLETRTYYGGDGTPMDEAQGRTLTYTLAQSGRLGYGASPCMIDVERLRADLANGGRIARWIDRIKAGHTVDWDGSNMRGRLDSDAQIADMDLEDYLAGSAYIDENYQGCGARYWLAGDGNLSAAEALENIGLTLDATEDQIKAAAENQGAVARAEGYLIAEDIADAIRDLIEEARQDEDEYDDN